MLWGVEPFADDAGNANFYIIDLVASPLDDDAAIKAIVDMYCRYARVLSIGIEKVGLSSVEVHVANALRSRGRAVSVASGGITILRPGGRKKHDRILKNLCWPLANGKIHVSTTIPKAFRDTLRFEMEKFPHWHDDVLDSLSYAYDMLADRRFGSRPEAVKGVSPTAA
jgi:hypothetical protein